MPKWIFQKTSGDQQGEKGFALIMESNTSEPVSQQEQVQKPILFYYNDAYYI